MVDTVRTLAALQALLADNTSQDISPQDVRDFLVSVYPNLPGARAYINATQSIPNNTPTILDWDAEDFDDDTMIDLGTSPSRITITTAGRYHLLHAGLWADSGSADRRRAEILLNGTDIMVRDERVSASGVLMGMLCSTVVDLSAADFVEVRVLQQSGGALDYSFANGSAPGSTFFLAQMVRR